MKDQATGKWFFGLILKRRIIFELRFLVVIWVRTQSEHFSVGALIEMAGSVIRTQLEVAHSSTTRMQAKSLFSRTLLQTSVAQSCSSLYISVNTLLTNPFGWFLALRALGNQKGK